GKATGMAATGARVVGLDLRPGRVRLMARNAADLGSPILPVVGDATDPPLRPASFDRVLLDAPCSGLGVLRRRPDARWRIAESDVAELAGLQERLLDAAIHRVRPGGRLVCSVCTLTAAETIEQAQAFTGRHRSAEPLEPLDGPWRPLPGGGRVLPQDAGTDGMAVFRWRIRSTA